MGAKAFAEDELGLWQVEGWVEFRAGALLHAVIGPEGLRAVGHFDGFEGLPAGMSAGEGGVVSGVPVLGEDDVLEERSDLVDGRDDLVTA